MRGKFLDPLEYSRSGIVIIFLGMVLIMVGLFKTYYPSALIFAGVLFIYCADLERR